MSVSLPPDLNQSRKFIEMLTGDPGATVTLCSLDDSPHQRSSVAREFHGTLEEHADELTRLNQQGAGIFLLVNEGDGVARGSKRSMCTASNIIRVRAGFFDLNSGPMKDVFTLDVRPDLVVQSSPRKWHVYLPVAFMPLEEFGRSQRMLAMSVGGNPDLDDLACAMRLPGFYHQKRKPFMTRIQWTNRGGFFNTSPLGVRARAERAARAAYPTTSSPKEVIHD